MLPCLCFIFAELQMVQMSLASSEIPLSLFCCKQVEECGRGGHLRVGRKNSGKMRLVGDKWKTPD